MGESEQLPMIFPEPFPIPWPTGNASLYLALREAKRRAKAVQQPAAGQDR